MPKPVKKKSATKKKSAAKRPSNDPNLRAFQLRQQHMGRTDDTVTPPQGDPLKAVISAHMSKLGAKGGKVSGAKRMTNLSDKQRRDIATKAAKARWKEKA